MAGRRTSCKGTWSLGKYEIDDCLWGFGGLQARAEGGGVERPRPWRDPLGEHTDVGEVVAEGKLPSISCNGRGTEVGESAGREEIASGDGFALIVL